MRKTIAFIAVIAVVLLTGCSTDMDTEVKGKRATSTTMSFDEPNNEVTPETPDMDGVIGGLVENVPSIDGLSYGDIRNELLTAVCDEIDDSDGDFAYVGDVIVDSSEGNFYFDYSDAGYLVAAAVLLECPEWYDAAQEFANS